jgi:transposase InsO family protein
MKGVYLMCGISRQAHHQAIRRQLSELEKESLYLRMMEQVREIHPGMGLRTMYDMLQPEGIGRDGYIALGLREGFRLKTLEKFIRTTWSVKSHRYRNLLVGKWFTGVNQLWSSDITYFYCLNRFYYLVMIMDVYSRRIIGYSLADNMRAENNLKALKVALNLRGESQYHHQLIHHSDKGSQYVSDIYTETLDNYGIQISMCDEVYENTHIERVHETIKNQYLNRMNIQTEQDLIRKVDLVIDIYNTKRPHKSLSRLSPVGFEAYLETIPMDKRFKMEIYTINKVENQDFNQLKIGFN